MQNLYSSFKFHLLKVAKNLMKDSSDAEDAVQDTLLRLWKEKDKIKNEDDAKALAVTTTKNICIDKIRRKNLIKFETLDDYENFQYDDSMQRRADSKEEYNLICKIIEEKLSPLQKKILKMKEFDNMEFDEIASLLNMQPAAVRMNLSRERKEIRDIYTKFNS